jgi:hypothetical protein
MYIHIQLMLPLKREQLPAKGPLARRICHIHLWNGRMRLSGGKSDRGPG